MMRLPQEATTVDRAITIDERQGSVSGDGGRGERVEWSEWNGHEQFEGCTRGYKESAEHRRGGTGNEQFRRAAFAGCAPV